MNWYAVRIKNREEEIAEGSLRRLGVEVFSPKLKQKKTIRRKRQTVVAPLFPGYFFASFNVHTQFNAVNFAHGVRHVVVFGLVPAVVDKEMIESIRSRLEDGVLIIQPTTFHPGQTVSIEDGHLRGLQAVFEREMTGQERVVLLLDSLSYQAHVVIDREYIRSV